MMRLDSLYGSYVVSGHSWQPSRSFRFSAWRRQRRLPTFPCPSL